MIYKILADTVLVIHFTWVLFALFGFIITLLGFFRNKFFDKWLLGRFRQEIFF